MAPIRVGVNGKPEDVRAVEDRGITAVAVEVIGEKKRGIAAGQAAGRRTGVFALDPHVRSVIGRGNDDAVAFGVDLPFTREVGPELGPDIGKGVVNVRVDDAGPRGKRGGRHKKQKWKEGTQVASRPLTPTKKATKAAYRARIASRTSGLKASD